jgi:hypothetical protein
MFGFQIFILIPTHSNRSHISMEIFILAEYLERDKSDKNYFIFANNLVEKYKSQLTFYKITQKRLKALKV